VHSVNLGSCKLYLNKALLKKTVTGMDQGNLFRMSSSLQQRGCSVLRLRDCELRRIRQRKMYEGNKEE
jgi:hypothetical protein